MGLWDHGRWLLRQAAWPLRIFAGAVLVVVGLILAIPGVPGPGLAIAAAGVLIAAPNSRLAHWIRAKGHQLRVWIDKQRGRAEAGPSGQPDPERTGRGQENAERRVKNEK